jgi:hypothetical protein
MMTNALLYLRVNGMSNVSIQCNPADFGEDKKTELFPLWPLLWPTRKVTRKSVQENLQTTIRARGLDLGFQSYFVV